MTTILGILVGAIIVAMIWMCVYFSQEIQDVRADARMRTSTYKPPEYHMSYKEFALKKERDEWKKKYVDLWNECEKDKEEDEEE